jgi:hypothetical protein
MPTPLFCNAYSPQTMRALAFTRAAAAAHAMRAIEWWLGEQTISQDPACSRVARSPAFHQVERTHARAYVCVYVRVRLYLHYTLQCSCTAWNMYWIVSKFWGIFSRCYLDSLPGNRWLFMIAF